MYAEARLPYEHSLLSREPLRMHCEDGRSTLWEVERWLAPADPADATALDRAEGPALDVGCGPGRIVAALAERGVLALGIDVAETAVRMTRDRGLNTLRRDVFTAVPGEGRWASVLLLDGNIGIGGDPARLLARVRQLLRPTGSLIVEAHHDDDVDEQLIVRFTSTGQLLGPPFEWAHVGLRALTRHARAEAYSLAETWRVDARVFARFVPEPVLAAG